MARGCVLAADTANDLVDVKFANLTSKIELNLRYELGEISKTKSNMLSK